MNLSPPPPLTSSTPNVPSAYCLNTGMKFHWWVSSQPFNKRLGYKEALHALLGMLLTFWLISRMMT